MKRNMMILRDHRIIRDYLKEILTGRRFILSPGEAFLEVIREPVIFL